MKKMRYYNIVTCKRGQLTQLVECLRHMEEVRGSSPLLPTSNVTLRPLSRHGSAKGHIQFPRKWVRLAPNKFTKND